MANDFTAAKLTEATEEQSAILDLSSIILNLKRQTEHRVAFHKASGEFISFCGNRMCALTEARHWHRDCSNSGKAANAAKYFGMNNMTLGDYENDLGLNRGADSGRAGEQ
ncbi:hypothetical protein CYMTET_21306 [Cymbomonas tetramitiformis]|uniref:Uncharacterized protein n=1 Tax=Cymbomonas tetramitiformis TaxID=36881 RepID=A0AAE0G299_9CHLO|nr:hypothetical protein CYMTET_21306 [Cymbomonas tetramitiformis]